MNWGQLLFSFEGRVGRATYWYFVLAVVVLFAVLGMLFGLSMAKVDPETGAVAAGSGGMVLGLIGLLILWPSLAITAKRWHDVDKSAWWILIGLVPAVGGLIALVFNGFIAGTPGPNRFGPAPN